jgi:hypothetical protein
MKNKAAVLRGELRPASSTRRAVQIELFSLCGSGCTSEPEPQSENHRAKENDGFRNREAISTYDATQATVTVRLARQGEIASASRPLNLCAAKERAKKRNEVQSYFFTGRTGVEPIDTASVMLRRR